jgi:bis(5'-nucleosidyl)-tetraphosphatase
VATEVSILTPDRQQCLELNFRKEDMYNKVTKVRLPELHYSKRKIQSSLSRLQTYFGPLPRKMINLPRTEVPDSEPVSERSYGIIPIRIIQTALSPEATSRQISTANTQVLLVQQRPVMQSHPPFWSFPKGHPERGDTSEVHTAIREVGEETGIVVKEDGILFKDAEGLTERYRNPVRGWVKEVRYWIGVVEGQRESKFDLQEAELVDARWLSWNDALDLLTFEKGKELLRRAVELLDGETQVESDGSNSTSVTNEVKRSGKL